MKTTSKSSTGRRPLTNGRPGAKTNKRTNGRSNESADSTLENQNSKLQKLFEDELKDIYWAEKALTKAIPKMIKKASSDDLISTLESHLHETEEHVQRCEQIFESLGQEPKAKKCEAMDGLIKEAEEIVSDTDAGMMRDAGIISAAQKVEHYEIASYGTLRTFARTLGHETAVALLEQTLEEEKAADQALTEVAEACINEAAAAETE